MGFETYVVLMVSADSEDFEAVPMGFETLVVHCLRMTEIILKQSLWDLKLFCFSPFLSSAFILKQSLWDLKRGSQRKNQ